MALRRRPSPTARLTRWRPVRTAPEPLGPIAVSAQHLEARRPAIPAQPCGKVAAVPSPMIRAVVVHVVDLQEPVLVLTTTRAGRAIPLERLPPHGVVTGEFAPGPCRAVAHTVTLATREAARNELGTRTITQAMATRAEFGGGRDLANDLVVRRNTAKSIAGAKHAAAV